MTNDEATRNEGGHGSARRWVVWIAVFGGIILLMLLRDRWESQCEVLSQYQFEQLLDAGQIARATIIYDEQKPLNQIVGKYYKNQNDSKIEVSFRATIRLTEKLETRLLSSPHFDLRQPNRVLMSAIWSILPIVVISAFIWFFFIRQVKRVTITSLSLQERIAKEVEQQSRFDKILDRWEQQADRMDAILDRAERSPKGNP